MIKFGQKVSCASFGVSGIVVSLVQHINGCESYEIRATPKEDADKPSKEHWLSAVDIDPGEYEQFEPEFAITLGDKVKDRVTGFEGVAVSRYAYHTGTVCYTLRPIDLKDGLIQKDQFLDEQHLVESSKAKSGGPSSHQPEPSHQ